MTDHVRNAWYVAARADELRPDAILPRTLLGEPMVLFRGRDGKAAALNDRCPHRKFPLSRGRMVDGEVECGYHGARFEGSGACDEPGWRPVFGYHYVRGNYLLVLDNLLDLTHVAFVHKSTLNSPQVTQAPLEVQVEADAIHTLRITRGADCPPLFRRAKPDLRPTRRRTTSGRWCAPSRSTTQRSTRSCAAAS